MQFNEMQKNWKMMLTYDFFGHTMKSKFLINNSMFKGVNENDTEGFVDKQTCK